MAEESEPKDNVDMIDSPDEVPGYLSQDKLESILAEIAEFDVELVEDPTLPQYGIPYLQKCVAQCRQYLNRVQYYLQICKRFEKNLKKASLIYELDLELKVADLLSSDPVVRQQSASSDRKALAVSMLKEEHQVSANFRVTIQDLDDTIRLIKSSYDNLKRTNSDIRLQRQLVKDDKDAQFGGEEGYSRPQAREDGAILGGMAPAVKPDDINPEELREGVEKEEIPKPEDIEIRNKKLADFLKGGESHTPDKPVDNPEPPPKAAAAVTYQDLLDD